jgi:hypothetical protein
MTDNAHLFTDEDIKKILSEQADIRVQLEQAATNLGWVVKYYNKQCTDTESLKKDLNDFKITIWKYIGIGIGAGLGINFALSIAVFIATGGKAVLV